MEPLLLNAQICQAYSTLQHKIQFVDQLLFQKTLSDCLLTSPQSKLHWLEAVKIAVHEFHGRIPTQIMIVFFFSHSNTEPSTDQHSPVLNTSMSRQSMPCSIDHVGAGSKLASSWKEVDLWQDPAGDFDPLFEY
eukprot:1040995-Ditylum_brightwellii.AAC.1